MSDENPQEITQPQDEAVTTTTDTETGDLDESAQGGDDIEALRSKLDKSVRAEKNLRERLKAAEPLLQQAEAAREAQKTDLERAQEAATAAAEQVSKLRDRAVRAEAKALAAADFANPDVALRLLDLETYVSDDGDIDTARISTDLAELLEREPYLGRTQAVREMKPNPAQGRSGGLTLDQQIAEAEKSRNFSLAISLKRQRATQN